MILRWEKAIKHQQQRMWMRFKQSLTTILPHSGDLLHLQRHMVSVWSFGGSERLLNIRRGSVFLQKSYLKLNWIEGKVVGSGYIYCFLRTHTHTQYWKSTGIVEDSLRDPKTSHLFMCRLLCSPSHVTSDALETISQISICFTATL